MPRAHEVFAGVSDSAELSAQLISSGLHDLVDSLSDASGCRLVVVEDTIDVTGGDLSVTAQDDSPPLDGSELRIRAMVRLFVGIATTDKHHATALLFLFANGVRIAASGRDYAVFTLDMSQGAATSWQFRGWEHDEYDEWDNLVSPS